MKAVKIEKKDMSLIFMYKAKKIRYPRAVSIMEMAVINHDPFKSTTVRITNKIPQIL